MYRHLLVATDGSELSTKAFTHALGVARPLGARITAFWAGPPVPVEVYGDGALPEAMLMPRHAERVRAEAERIFEPMRRQAESTGVPFDAVHVLSDVPWSAIIDAAKAAGCDAIVMASHGRRGVGALLLGSETQKVLTHSALPVLVVR